MMDGYISRWHKPFPFRNFLSMAGGALVLAGTTGALFLVFRDNLLLGMTVVFFSILMLLIGLFVLFNTTTQKVVFKIHPILLITKRIQTSMATAGAYAGIHTMVEEKIAKTFPGQFTKMKVFSPVDLSKVDCWMFLGGDMRLFVKTGLGRVVIRLEWHTQDGKRESRKVKKLLSKLDYNKAVSSTKYLGFCRRCFVVKPRKGKEVCPNCGILLDEPVESLEIINR